MDLEASLREELASREKQITKLNEECVAIGTVLEIMTRRKKIFERGLTRPEILKRRRQSKALTGRHCEKHPGAQFNKRGACRSCISIAIKAAWDRKKAAVQSPANGSEKKTEQPDTRVPCLVCGERLANAKELGLHNTRLHFGDSSLGRSSLAGIQ